jgi:spore maturation protein CgeB
MKIVIFGLTITSSWGNGHATLWRALCRALARRGHQMVFFEHDAPYYAAHRDLYELNGCDIQLYRSWDDVQPMARRHLEDCDAAIVTSYCPDAVAAGALLRDFDALRVFYDLDAPITLDRLRAGGEVPYIGALPPLGPGLSHYELTLSYTGGRALGELQTLLHAPRVTPLYGSVDPEAHFPVARVASYVADLSYLGTYAADRQATLNALFIEPARQMPAKRFVIGGSMYPDDFPWTPNIFFIRHVPPPNHPAFFCSSRLTLNVTRQPMAAMGYCPSGRLFEAAACGAPLVSDWWEGLETFFDPWREIIVARNADQVVTALELSDHELAHMAVALMAMRMLLVILRERPDVIVTTGAAPGYFALRFGKWIGARTIWLDSIANVNELSMSGRIVAQYADLWLTQWPHLARPARQAMRRPEYAGAVL